MRVVAAAAACVTWFVVASNSFGSPQTPGSSGSDGPSGPSSPPGSSGSPSQGCTATETPCDLLGEHEGGGAVPSLECPCGPGLWIEDLPQTHIEPTVPFDEVEESGQFILRRKAHATPKSASVRVKGWGTSACAFGCVASSATLTERSAFSFRQREFWQGALPACPRLVGLAAMGIATQAVGVSTTAHMGCSASSSSSLAGACSSLGDASAQLGQSLSAQAQFSAANSTVKLSGNIGAMVTVDSASIQGSFSKIDSWEAVGIGSAAGTASFTVKPDRTYCAFTNKPVTKRALGAITAAGAGAVASGGGAAFEAEGSIRLWIE